MNKIIQGDCMEVLKTLKEKSINMCMTSPPYWALRDYGTASWEGGDKGCDHIEKTANIRDCSGGFSGRDKGTRGNQPSATTSKKQYTDKCKKCGAKRVDKQLGLEPTFDEYINKLCNIFDEVKRVLRDDGTCWVNLGDSYSSGSDKSSYKDSKIPDTGKPVQRLANKQGLPPKTLCLIPFRFAIEMINRGWILRNTIIWYKPNCMPSSVKDRFTIDFEYIFFFSKKKQYYFETQYEPMAQSTINDSRLGKKIVTENKKDWEHSGAGSHRNPAQVRRSFENLDIKKGRNKRTVWRICPKPFKESHFAVYPEELCETPIKAGCPEGGIVLDPFFGAGTTGLVALKQKKKFLGIELNSEYIEIANERLKPFLEQEKL